MTSSGTQPIAVSSHLPSVCLPSSLTLLSLSALPLPEVESLFGNLTEVQGKHSMADVWLTGWLSSFTVTSLVPESYVVFTLTQFVPFLSSLPVLRLPHCFTRMSVIFVDVSVVIDVVVEFY